MGKLSCSTAPRHPGSGVRHELLAGKLGLRGLKPRRLKTQAPSPWARVQTVELALAHNGSQAARSRR